MSHIKAVDSTVQQGVIFAALLIISGLASCSGPADTTNNTAPTNTSVSFTALPASIISGASTTLNWSSSNSTTCTLSGGQFGASTTVNTSGARTAQPLTSTNYTITCTGLNGSASQSVTVAVGVAAPVVTLSATPSSIQNGATSHITWSATDITACNSSGGGGAGATGSFNTPPLTVTTTYTIICTGPGGSSSQSITVNVAAASVPTVTLSAMPPSIASGATSVITWSSTNSTSCSSSGGGGVGTTGSFTTLPLTTTTTFSVTCTGLGGVASQSKTVTVGTPASPTATLSATPSSVASGATSLITWSSTNSTSCSSSGGGGSGITGSFTSPPLTSTTNYSVTCTGAGGSASQSTTVTIAGASCSTFGATAAISLPGVVTSRQSGVAPLAIFFDATGTTSTATARPFHDLEYRWNFGENIGVLATLPGGTNWSNGSTKDSRNLATGPVAAHVYETPGTYTIGLTVYDGTNTVSNNCTQIVVQDPDLVFADANTICVAAQSLPTQGVGGCPAHATTAVQPNFATAISSYALTGKRVLFKRSDVFTSNSTASIINTGPGTLGAFGVGPSPVLRMSGNTNILLLSSATTPTIKDWRVMDLELDGMSNTSSMGIGSAGGINQVTLLRLNIHDTHNGISLSDSILDWLNTHGYPGQTIWDQISIVDSSVLHTIGGAGGNGVGLAAKRLSMQGNLIDDSISAEHILRVFNVNKGIISNNTLSRQATAKAIIKMHGPTWLNGTPPLVAAGSYTEQAIISDNKIVASNGTDWTVNTGPQNAQSDERLRNIIVERNWFVGGNTTQVGLVVNAVEETIRNNICVNSSGKFIQVSYRSGTTTGLEPPPLNVHVYNNTVYSSSSQNGDVIVADIRAPSTNTSAYNNLGTTPFAINPSLFSNSGSGTMLGNNLLSNNPSAIFVNSTPTAPLDFSLKSLPNLARDAGLSTIPVMSDFFRAGRPQNGVTDIGAIEGP